MKKYICLNSEPGGMLKKAWVGISDSITRRGLISLFKIWPQLKSISISSQCAPMNFNIMTIKPIIKPEKSWIYTNKCIQIKPEFITLNFIQFCLYKGVHFSGINFKLFTKLLKNFLIVNEISILINS